MIRKTQSRDRSIIRGEHGAVTIYTILIIVPIFIFQAVLIDFVRIKVATMEAEQATRAATRSVLSAYDKRLLDYGLFGLKANTEEQKIIANRVLSKYGTDEMEADTFRWLVLNPLVDQTSVIPMYTLADHRLISQQILEDMKYKAPIEFTRNLYDKWKGKKEIVKNVEEEVHQAGELDALLKQREKRLESAFDHVKQMINRIEEMYVSYDSILTDTVDEAEVDEETDDEEEDSDSIEDTNEEDDSNNAYEDLLTTARDDFNYLQQQYQEMNGFVLEAEQIEQSMLQQWDQETKGKLNDAYILGHQFYLDYTIGATTPISTFGAFINKLSSYQDEDFQPASTQGFYDSFQSWFSRRSNEENRRVAAFENLEQKKEEQRKNIDNQNKQIKQAANAQVCPYANTEQYEHLKSYYQRYLNFNNSNNSNNNQQEYDPSNSLDQSSDQYQTSSISFLSNLTNLMESIRDEAYVNEYSLYYFNHRTTSMLRFVGPLQAKLNQHTLQGQEVEYILYGLSSCTANRMAAYAEIYMLRFTIRMIEALTDARKAAIGSPLLMVLIAAAEGGIKAYRDMERITNGEELPVLEKWGTITMNYADYLRMFLTVHSKDDRKLSRIQALIQLNTQIDLQHRPAYIEVKSVMTMRLWFIRGKQYQIKKTAAMSY